MPPKHKAKPKKQEEEDEFERILAELERTTKHAGLLRSKAAQHDETVRARREKERQEIIDRRNTNDFELALLKRQKHLKFQQLLEQIMSAQQRSFLTEPKTEFKGGVEKSNPRFDIAVGEMQGWRAHMEDEHVIDVAFPGSAGNTNGLFCVFDGHSGKDCAELCKRHFPIVMRKHLIDDSIDFEEAYLEIDELLATDLKENPSGCTAVTVHVSETHVRCASVGDSRAVLCRGGVAQALSADHKPENEGEHDRITAAGGFVKDNRVNGQLAMSRAMGDFTYKTQKERGVCEQLVIPQPDVFTVNRDRSDQFVVLACDGIFDVLENEELVAMILEQKAQGLNNLKICEAICNHCLAPAGERGQPARPAGTDNMTICIVDLK